MSNVETGKADVLRELCGVGSARVLQAVKSEDSGWPLFVQDGRGERA